MKLWQLLLIGFYVDIMPVLGTKCLKKNKNWIRAEQWEVTVLKPDLASRSLNETPLSLDNNSKITLFKFKFVFVYLISFSICHSPVSKV